MATIAYDLGSMIEIVISDETGGVDYTVEVDVAMDESRNEALESAGFSILGEWDDYGTAYVEEF